MLKPIIWTVAALLMIFILPIRSSEAEIKPHTYEPVAVVELFTSEGCSSCPPADALLGKITEEARKNGTRVFPLSFHVDYWNYLGWKDPYSDAAFSDRQRKYGYAMSLRSIYTPQMIVNGTDQFVGHREDLAKTSIARFLNTRTSVKVQIDVTGWDNEVIQVNINAVNAQPDMDIHVALVERGLKQNIARGENQGRVLHHENVVRAFKTVAASKGRVSIQPPPDVDRSNASIIAYVQETGTKRIVGASLVDCVK